ncbi:MAG: hypothetical protein KAI47_23290, partial [Deltaproteobacteria bacterium]|nr:hypothetical protein [Deltaproteobacteria bacterium]
MTYATPRHVALALLAAGIILVPSACTKKMSREAAPTASAAPAASQAENKKKLAVATKIPRKKHPGGEGKMGSRSGPELSALGGKMREKKEDGEDKKGLASPKDQDDAPEAPTIPTRAWFPETFLFSPLVVTDPSGKARVTVRVPDRLTTWRVLALAHSRSGSQAGAVASFLGTLPVYVEPIVPKVLRAGDVVRVPINLVNTTQEAISTALSISAQGIGVQGGATQKIALGPAQSLVRYATLRATQIGEAKILAQLAGADRIARAIRIDPLGRPVKQHRSGTLASPRTLTIHRAAGANPALGRVILQVFPGALALLRSELASAGSRRGNLADDAFALLLAGKAPALLKALGAPLMAPSGQGPQPKDKTRAALRDLSILATQRVLRHARVLNITSATLLAEAALAHPQNPILSRLGARAVETIAQKQLPDGTCGGATGWTLQRLLVSTADCVRAAAHKRTVVVRAAGAFERNAERIKDPYTAAAVLASGAISGPLAARLRTIITRAIKTRRDGAKIIALPRYVVRADGHRPSTVEATALAALALIDVPKAPVTDLGAAILSGYAPGRGWGDGRANLVCMKAALKLFRNPLPPKVTITLRHDGQEVATRALDSKHLRDVVTLAAPARGHGTQRWTILADPAVPGLGFSMTLTDRVPWKKTKAGGIE